MDITSDDEKHLQAITYSIQNILSRDLYNPKGFVESWGIAL